MEEITKAHAFGERMWGYAHRKNYKEQTILGIKKGNGTLTWNCFVLELYYYSATLYWREISKISDFIKH